jgi:peptide deformylase
MFIKLKEVGGIGLAAPQVSRFERFFIVKLPDSHPIAIFDPAIVATSIEMESDWEGCLSIPGKVGLVERAVEIGIQSYNVEQKRYFLSKANGLLARVIQHEMDHLDGILFIDKAKEIKYTALANHHY